MNFTELNTAALKQAMSHDLLGEYVTIRGTRYDAVIDDVTASEAFAAGGAIPSEPISIVLKKRTWTPGLTLGERVTARSATYVVRQIVSDEISTTLICDKPEKR